MHGLWNFVFENKCNQSEILTRVVVYMDCQVGRKGGDAW